MITLSISIALIGFGYWGPNIAKNIAASKKTRLYAICEANSQRLERARNMYVSADVKLVSDYHQLLDDPNVDAVAIATATQFNYRIAMDAIAAGKHLFIEKPMTATSAQAREIAEAAEKKGIIIHVDHIMVYHNIIEYIKNIIDSGDLGELLYYDSSRINLGPIRKDVNAMLDLAVHDLAVIDYMSNGKTPFAVSAAGGVDYANQEALTYLTMKYDNFIAHIKSSWISPVKERRIIVGCTKKMIIFDDVKATDKLIIYDSGIEVETTDVCGEYEYKVRTGDTIAPFFDNKDALLASVEHFADCINSGIQSRSSPLQAIRVIEILERAQECMQAGNGY